MQKNILIISAVFPPEQVTSAYLNYDLAKELAKSHDVTVLRPYPTRPLGTEFKSLEMEDKSFRTVLIDSYTHPQSELIGRFKESLDFGRKCAAYIKEKQKEIDFIYNDGWQLFGLYIVAKIAHKFEIPYMVPIQDIYPECLFTNKNYPKIIRKGIYSVLFPIDKYYQSHAECVRTISDEMRDYLSSTRDIPVNNYLVVNNWQNDEDYLKDYPARTCNGKVVFAYVGSINGHANVDLLIKAFVDAKLQNAEFRIYGGGNKKDYCVELVRQLGANNIVFDMVSREKVAYAQSQSDILVLALPKGNGNLCLPSKLTSYMLSGKPILASVDDESATARIIRDNNCGKTIPPDEGMQLMDAFKYFSSLSAVDIKRMGSNSKQYATKLLTREINLKMVTERIEKILK